METKNNNYQEKLTKVTNLAKKLMPNHPYHNIDHVLDVYSTISKLADLERVNTENKFLLQTASLLHDTLFEINNPDNEKISSEVAKRYLPKLGYCSNQTKKVADLILATKLPTNPSNLLEEIICDADLDNLGRSDFIKKGDGVRKEFKLPKNKTWYEIQLKFLQNHNYYTISAKQLRDKGKQKNIEKLKKLLQNNK